jgi:hypothetical protein
MLLANGDLFLFQPLRNWTIRKECIIPWIWYNTPNPEIILEWTGTQWLSRNKQGRSLNKYSKDRVRMTEDPSIIAHAQVTIHRSSLDKTDMVKITTTIPRQIINHCPWKKEYQRLPTHIRCIISP